MKKFSPPIDFFKFREKDREITPNQMKAALVNNSELGCAFLTLYLNNPQTATELTSELNKIFEKSYRQKTYRILNELVRLHVVHFKKFSDINKSNPSDFDKTIIKKHQNFLSKITNPWGNNYDHMVYYYISNHGLDILEFVAKKYNFNEEE